MSRLVRMPTSLPVSRSTTGKPEILRASLIRMISPTVWSGMDRDRIDHHAALELLDHLHLVGLFGGRHVAVNDAHAAGLRHGDGEARFGDRIHRGGDERDVELDAAGQPGLGDDVGGQHFGRARFEEHVVKGQSFTDFHGRLVEILRRLGKGRAAIPWPRRRSIRHQFHAPARPPAGCGAVRRKPRTLAASQACRTACPT